MAEQGYLRNLLWAVALIIIVSPLIPILHYLGRPDLTFQSICVALALAGVVYAAGSMRRHWWFWATMLPIAGAHVLFILRVPWPEWVPAPILSLLATVDAVIIFLVLGFIEKAVGPPSQSPK
jgi:O-antigen/teichoic acid export membrane protein